MINNIIKFLLLFFLLFLISCKKIEILNPVIIDYDKLARISINAENKKIGILFESTFQEPYIDHSLTKSPIYYLNQWIDNNINTFGTENTFEINIIEASVKKSEIPNTDSKKYEEKTIFLFEVYFLLEFFIYDDSKFKLVSTIVEAKRTTTSGKYISLLENEKIIDNLIYNCLIDFSKKADELIKIHMQSFIL